MGDLLQFLFLLAVVVTVVTVVGHGLWLIFAAIFRVLFRGKVTADTPSRCPRCGHPTGIVGQRCTFCGHVTAETADPDLETTSAQLEKLREGGLLGDEPFEAVQRAIALQRARLRGPIPVSETERRAAAGAKPGGPPAVASSAPEPGGLEIVEPAPPPLDTEAEIVEAEIVTAEAATPSSPFDVPDLPETTPVGVAARRTLADLLQGFMEEKNIRWGEIASGMLIVGSAIGLVISLRATLAELSEKIPYLPALFLMVGTALIHGAGLYTLKRWNLRSTSRGVLIIATLLIPLSFAAGIVLSGQGTGRIAVTSPVYLVAAAVGIVGYGLITFFSSRALLVEGWWRLLVAVMGTSLGQMIVNRLANVELADSTLISVSFVFALPLLSFVYATCSQAYRLATRPRITPATANQTFLVLGVAAFSLAVPLVLLVWLRGDVRNTLAALSPSLSIASATILSLGLLLHNGVAASRMALVRTAGTALAILGGLLMLASLGLAWPRPDILVTVGIVNAATLVALAIAGRLPALHTAAVGSAGIAYVVGFHWLQGNLESSTDVTGRQLLSALLMGRTSAALITAVAVVAAIAWLFAKLGRTRESLGYWLGAGLLTTIAVAVAVYAGFWSGIDAELATPVLAIAAAGILVGGNLRNNPWLSWFGSALLLATWVQAVGFNDWVTDRLPRWRLVTDRPIVFAALAHALSILAVAAVGAVLSRRRTVVDGNPGQGLTAGWVRPLATSATITSAVAIPFILIPWNWNLDVQAVHVGMVALSWLAASRLLGLRQLTVAAEVVATVAVCLGTAALVQRQDWLPEPLTDLRHLHAQVIALAAWCIVLSLLKTWRSRSGSVTVVEVPLERELLIVITAISLTLAMVGCWPGIAVELGYRAATTATSSPLWHSQAFQSTGWLALAAIVVALIINQWRGLWLDGGAALAVTAATAAMLFSGSFESENAVASALRWSFAAGGLLLSGAWCARRLISQTAQRLGVSGQPVRESSRHYLRWVIALCSYLPVVALTSVVLVRVAVGATFGGPLVDSLFGRMSHAISYATPLSVVVLAMLMVAVRDRLSGMAFAAAMTFVYVVALAVLLPVLSAGAPLTSEVWATLLASCGCGLGGFALLWLALSPWIERRGASPGSRWLQVQLAAAAAVTLLLPAWAVALFLASPDGNAPLHATLGAWPGYLAATLAMLAFAWYFRRDGNEAIVHLLAAYGVTLGVLACSTLQGARTPPDWLGYHSLTVGLLVAGALAALAASWATWGRRRGASGTSLSVGATCLAAAALVLVVRGCLDDPLGHWWTVGTSAAVMATLALLGVRGRSQRYAYATWGISLFTASVLWAQIGQPRPLANAVDLVMFLMATSATLAFGWLAVEVWYQMQRDESMDLRFRFPPIHRTVAVAGSLILLLVAGGTTLSATVARLANLNPPFSISEPMHFVALGTLTALLIGTLWDRRAMSALGALYLCGLAAITMVLNLIEQRGSWGPQGTVIGVCLLGATYIAATGHLWKWGLNLAQIALKLRMPQPIARIERASKWLPVVNILGSLAICALGFVTVLTLDVRWMRMSAAFAPLLLAYGISCLAQGRRRAALQCLTLVVASVAGIYIGWADMAPSDQAIDWLVRAIRLLLVLCAATFVYGVFATRWVGVASDWYEALRRAALILGVAALAALCVVLSMEVSLFQPGVGILLETPLVVVVAAMLGALAFALLSMAIAAGRDPLNLSDRGRQGYVYLAQMVVALLFGHLYLTRPQLFDSFLRPYWPYLVMLLAFGGVAVGELCSRRGWRVIGEPLQRSGGLLPLIPVLGMWIVGSNSVYSLLLLFVGLLYLFLCITRRSLVSGVLAAVAGNAALWAFWHESSWTFGSQPQLWMIPPALSVLLAAQINRRRLTANQLTTIRYVCATIIYVSSTGEMFMKMMTPAGHADLLRPMILASLSVAGIMAGMMLRIRAFLYLGASFLFLSIVTMVWHAARMLHHTWPWWAFGIGLGLMILVMFGLFEKKRSELNQLVERMRQWEQ